MYYTVFKASNNEFFKIIITAAKHLYYTGFKYLFLKTKYTFGGDFLQGKQGGREWEIRSNRKKMCTRRLEQVISAPCNSFVPTILWLSIPEISTPEPRILVSILLLSFFYFCIAFSVRTTCGFCIIHHKNISGLFNWCLSSFGGCSLG